MQKNSMTYKLVQVGLFVALEIVLSRFLSINTQFIKIGLNFIPIAIVAMLYGPLWGAVTAAMGDFLGAVLFPIGPYFPGFTLTAALSGVVYGLFLYKRRMPGVVAAAGASSVVALPLHLGLNSLWLHILYGQAMDVLIPMRAVQCLVTLVAQFLIIWLLAGRIKQLMKHGA